MFIKTSFEALSIVTIWGQSMWSSWTWLGILDKFEKQHNLRDKINQFTLLYIIVLNYRHEWYTALFENTLVG